MLEMINTLKLKYKLDLTGDFELVEKGDNITFRYHSLNSAIGSVSSRPMKVDRYVVDLLSFMECVSFLETAFV